jgi:hypothetical protein
MRHGAAFSCNRPDPGLARPRSSQEKSHTDVRGPQGCRTSGRVCMSEDPEPEKESQVGRRGQVPRQPPYPMEINRKIPLPSCDSLALIRLRTHSPTRDGRACVMDYMDTWAGFTDHVLIVSSPCGLTTHAPHITLRGRTLKNLEQQGMIK